MSSFSSVGGANTDALYDDIARFYRRNRRTLLSKLSEAERQFLFLRLIMPPSEPAHALYRQIPSVAEALEQALLSDSSLSSDGNSSILTAKLPAKQLTDLYVSLYERVASDESRLRETLGIDRKNREPLYYDLDCFVASLRDYLATDSLRSRFFAQSVVIPALLRAARQSNPFEPAVFNEFVDTLRRKSAHIHSCDETTPQQATLAPFRRICLRRLVGTGVSGSVYEAAMIANDSNVANNESNGADQVVAVKVVVFDPLVFQREKWIDARQVEAQFAKIASNHGIGPRFIGHWIVGRPVDDSKSIGPGTCFTSDDDNRKSSLLISLLVTELIAGGTLQDVLDDTKGSRNNNANNERLRSIVDQLNRKVESLHALGIVHGDLQPKNVLVSNDGAVALIDWGLAFPIGALPRIPWSPLLHYHREQPLAKPFYNNITVSDLLDSPTRIDRGIVDTLQGESTASATTSTTGGRFALLRKRLGF